MCWLMACGVPFGKQDAMLGHAALWGDRGPQGSVDVARIPLVNGASVRGSKAAFGSDWESRAVFEHPPPYRTDVGPCSGTCQVWTFSALPAPRSLLDLRAPALRNVSPLDLPTVGTRILLIIAIA